MVTVGEICKLVNGKAFKPADWSEQGAPIIRIQNLNDPNKPFNYWAGSLDRQVKIKPGDVLLAWSGTPGTSFGVHIWNRGTGILNQHIFRVDLDDDRITADWFRYAVNGRLYQLIAQAHGGVGLQHVTRPMVDRLQIPLPPLDEQKRIAAILDKADQLRQKRRQAIALLDSLNQSIFLDMFGDLTQTRKLAEVASIKSGSTPSRSEADNFGGLVPWVKTTEVKGQTINLTEETVTEKGVRAARLKLFSPNTILMAMYGQGATRGKVAILGIPATINQACAAIQPNEGLDAVFLFHQLKLRYDEIRSLGRGGNQPNLNLELVGSLDVKIPPISEQQKFKRLIETITDSAKRQSGSENNCESLFASLQHRAFTGQI